MPRFPDNKMTYYRRLDKGKIPYEIQDLMPDKLVLEPEPVLVDYSEIVNNHGVVKRPALGKSVFFEGLVG